MTIAVVHSRGETGIHAPPVAVEVHLGGGLPGFSIVGLPETAVREARDRVRSAIQTTGFEFPQRRITANLAPADLPKEGGRFDLPIALGILAASGQLRHVPDDTEFLGELALTGELRPVRGVLSVAMASCRDKRRLVVPSANGSEAAMVSELVVQVADHLLQITAHLNGDGPLTDVAPTPLPEPSGEVPDLQDVRGQEQAKRALEIAAAGGHSALFLGPPGAGKTMLATRLPGLLPPLTEPEALETAALRSLRGEPVTMAGWLQRPFRAPHHSASGVALIGGGARPRPGEVSLAHHGVLFLDELPEFERRVLDLLREPLESGLVRIARAAYSAVFPARFQLIGAMNPCHCGYFGDPSGRCRCTPDQIRRYRARVSGPLLDRIDLHVVMPPVPIQDIRGDDGGGESSKQVRKRVLAARQQQSRRGGLNAQIPVSALKQNCRLLAPAEVLLARAMDRLGLSARAYHRILRIARTVADLNQEEQVGADAMSEAITYRVLDRTRPVL